MVRKPALIGSVIIPEGTARKYFALAGPGTVVVETRIGAAYLIAEQAPLALRPDDPRVLKVEVPQEPKRVRDEVQTDLDVMFLLLGGLSLIVGSIGIANITLVGVMERTPEIGLRRAIGVTRSHIALQFLLESASMGVSEDTIRRWKRRDGVADGSRTPHRLQTTLTPAQEVVVVELRKTLLLPPDDPLVVTREFIHPEVSRSGLDRCLRRHGVSNLKALLPQEESTKPPVKSFKDLCARRC